MLLGLRSELRNRDVSTVSQKLLFTNQVHHFFLLRLQFDTNITHLPGLSRVLASSGSYFSQCYPAAATSQGHSSEQGSSCWWGRFIPVPTGKSLFLQSKANTELGLSVWVQQTEMLPCPWLEQQLCSVPAQFPAGLSCDSTLDLSSPRYSTYYWASGLKQQ